jgi:hypothetical protein
MRLCLLVVTTLLIARPLGAQQYPLVGDERRGFWIGFGAGWATADAQCGACNDGRLGGIGGHVRAGATISPNFLVGAEADGWSGGHQDVDEWMTFGSLTFTVHTSTIGGFYFKAMLGGMLFGADVGVDHISATAPAVGVGIGYEVPLGHRGTFIAPYVNYQMTSPVAISVNDAPMPSDEIKINLLHIGVGLIWH